MEIQSYAAISVDLEDWYQGLELPTESWWAYEKRLEIGTDYLLELFEDHSITATFFSLGVVAKEHPKILRKIASAGHEIGSHSLLHKKIYDLTPEEFRLEEIESKNQIEQVVGRSIFGFRAPYFSITPRSLWALEVLSELGYAYDSSMSPVSTWRYGIKNLVEGIYELPNGLCEFTPSTMSILGKRFGLGGAYLRIFPLYFTKRALRHDGKGLYLHPWEFDLHQPRVKISHIPRFTHYFNLKTTFSKLSQLVESTKFISIESMIKRYKSTCNIRSLSLDALEKRDY